MEIDLWQITVGVALFLLGFWAIIVSYCLKNGDEADAGLAERISRLDQKLYNSVDSQNRLLDYLGLKEVTTIDRTMWCGECETTELVKKDKKK